MKKGDIFWAENKENNPHPIVFIEWIDTVRFKACILSTKPTNDNIPMLKKHFFENDENGMPYPIQFSNTYLVPNDSFIKMTFWLQSEVAQGKLTIEGIDFIDKNITREPVLCPAPIWRYKS